MTVPFKQVPANIRVPLFYAEVDNSRANTAQENQRTLLIGQITAGGKAVPNVPVLSQGDAQTVGGLNSMLSIMSDLYRANDPLGELWYLPLADATSSTAASGTISVGSVPTGSGTLSLYVGGDRYQIPVLPTLSAAQVATAIAAAINADLTCPVTAVATTSTVTLTAVNKGPAGNDIDIRLNYGGVASNEIMPAGLTLTITPMAGGATPPDLSTGLAALGDLTFDFIVCPYSDATTLDALKLFLNDQSGRWSYAKQLYGHVFTAARGTVGALTTVGTARNNQHETVMGFNDSPHSGWMWAAAMAGAAAVSLRVDPALPLQTVPINGILPPPVQSRFAMTDRNALLFSGISTFTVDQGGQVYIENLITTYQRNAFGAPDNSYLQVETLFTLVYVIREMRNMVTSKYGRMKLADDGTRFAAGSAIVTPSIIKADLIAKYRDLEYRGFVQNGDAFRDGLIVERDAMNPGRISVLWPGVLISQLRVFALLAQFRLM